jgi:hypothetical protein
MALTFPEHSFYKMVGWTPTGTQWDFSEIADSNGVLLTPFLFADTTIEMNGYTGAYPGVITYYTDICELIDALNQSLSDDAQPVLSCGSSNIVSADDEAVFDDITITVGATVYTFTKGNPIPDIGDYNPNTAVNPCADEFDLALPVYDGSDVEFEVFSNQNATATNAEGWRVAVCDLTGLMYGGTNMSTLTFYNSLNTGTSVGITGPFGDIRAALGVGRCFRFVIVDSNGDIQYISKYKFKIVSSKCHTTLIDYTCNENSLKFQYVDSAESSLGFSNKVRLWFAFNRPQLKEKKSGYRKSDGYYINSAVVMEKTYECNTEWMPTDMHVKLKVALAHDTITVVGGEADYSYDVYKEGDYEINWHDENPELPAPAEFKLKEAPFANQNHNCR